MIGTIRFIALFSASVLAVNCGNPNASDARMPTASTLSAQFTGDTTGHPELSTAGLDRAGLRMQRELHQDGGGNGPLCQFTLQWTSCPDDDFSYYILYRSRTPEITSGQGSPSIKRISKVWNDTVHVDDSPNWNTEYYYAIRTINDEENSSWSNELLITTPTIEGNPPDASVLAVDTVAYHYIDMVWSRCRNVDFREYELFSSETPGISGSPGAARMIYSTETALDTVYVNMNYLCEITLYFALRTTDLTGISSWSNEVAACFTSFSLAVLDSVNIGTNPEQMVLLPGRSRLYVTNCFSNGKVKVVDVNCFSVVASIEVESRPFGICALPSEDYLYVTLPISNKVAVIRVSDNTVADTIDVPGRPLGICSTLDGEYVFVSCYFSGEVRVIRTQDNTVVGTITVDKNPWGITPGPSGERIYVANSFDNTVSIIDASSFTEIAKVTVGSYPISVAFNSDGSQAYVSCWESNDVYVIDNSTYNYLGSIELEGAPGMLATDSEGFVVVPGEEYGFLTIVDPLSIAGIADLELGGAPWFPECHPNEATIFVSDYLGGKVYKIDEHAGRRLFTPRGRRSAPANPARHIEAALGHR